MAVAWPSGLRRWFKAPVSAGAWVRIPPLPFCFTEGFLLLLSKKSYLRSLILVILPRRASFCVLIRFDSHTGNLSFVGVYFSKKNLKVNLYRSLCIILIGDDALVSCLACKILSLLNYSLPDLLRDRQGHCAKSDGINIF